MLLLNFRGMGGRGPINQKKKQGEGKKEENPPNENPIEEKKKESKQDGSIYNWLHSQEGFGWLQIFVITNSVIILLTQSGPSILTVISALKESIFRE